MLRSRAASDLLRGTTRGGGEAGFIRQIFFSAPPRFFVELLAGNTVFGNRILCLYTISVATARQGVEAEEKAEEASGNLVFFSSDM